MELAVETIGGKLPIYAGTGTNTTRETVKLSQIAEKIGISAVSVITPSYISPTQQEIHEHFLQIARAVKFPVILYNNPARAGLKISTDPVSKLSKIPNSMGIKNDAQKRIVPLRRAFSMGTFPQVVKECLRFRDIDVGDARAPVSALTSDERKKLAKIVKAISNTK